ncbi:hypothetical protein GSI_04201 [Ganoderma sinense ZZ0214-1]|uniref:Calpain catalytic domain-containing protein n=1 Tax=Ganoderma sinense ZZ0214-1 TaxID=1077348 RepID=A0A2G8SJ49_9APHY|nr:hypothetical protein GSI_04201 [Ganoderma sinense ZZ0214-1]
MATPARQDAESSYNKAANAELARDFDKAFRLYIHTAEQYLQLSRQVDNQKLRTQYKGEAAKALERAEKIKAVKQDIKPVVKDEFSEGEQLYVLQKSSLVNQGFFPLWDSSDQPSTSSTQPPLSAEQIEHGASWRRPGSIQERAQSSSPRELGPADIVQHIVSDCSVCGAMVVAIDHHRRFGSSLIVSSLIPQGNKGLPTLSASGQYQFRILYNGAHRRLHRLVRQIRTSSTQPALGIDDQLPAYPDGTLMCVSAGQKGEIWPSLVEKAYMKLAGGYDFIGSDSSTDLHALTGWIPEVVDMKGSHFQREKTWARLIQGYNEGNCVLTLGTGEHVRESEIPVTLLPTHCYAVIGVHDSPDGDRRLTIFDPWVGPSEDPAEAETSSSKQKRSVDVPIDSIYHLFDGIYFSWNPAMFKHKLTFHGMWKRGGKGSDTSTHFRALLRVDPSSTPEHDEEIWMLLTRHLRSHRTQEEYIALTADSGFGPGVSSGYEVLSTKGEYTNVPHVLVKVKASHAEDLWTLVASYEGEREDVGFTLTVYSHRKASWVHAPSKLLYCKDVEGAFTHKTAGGNHTFPSYYLNPQYYLRVHPRAAASARTSRDTKSALSVTVSTDRHIPANLMLAWSQGARINELGHNDLALSSGPYSYGYATASGNIPPGDYTLVMSAFEPRHIGKFSLKVECSDRFDLTPILQEGAGMFSKVIRDEWTEQTAGGGPSSGTYASNPTYELHVSGPSAAQVRFRLQLAAPAPSLALNLTLFNPPTGAGALGRHVATSGPYSDAIAGVVIETLALQPGRYLVVPSTYKAGVQAAFSLVMYSSVAGVQIAPVKKKA